MVTGFPLRPSQRGGGDQASAPPPSRRLINYSCPNCAGSWRRLDRLRLSPLQPGAGGEPRARFSRGLGLSAVHPAPPAALGPGGGCVAGRNSIPQNPLRFWGGSRCISPRMLRAATAHARVPRARQLERTFSLPHSWFPGHRGARCLLLRMRRGGGGGPPRAAP